MSRVRTTDRPEESLELAIVLPAHNEAERIEPVLRSYAAHFGQRAQLLTVLNGCTDGTLEVVERVRRDFKGVEVIDVSEPIGKGGAVKTGFASARGMLVGFVDADGATTPAEFDRLCQLVVPGVDGVIASRWSPGSEVRNRTSPLRRIASVGFRLIVKVLFDLPYRDTQCGAKVFRRVVTDEVGPNLMNRDMTFDVELLVRIRSAGYRVIEVPTVWTDQSSPVLVGTPLKLLRTSWSMFASLLRLRRIVASEHLT